MGIFDRAKNAYKREQASLLLQKLLDVAVRAGLSDLEPRYLADELVSYVWGRFSDVCTGKAGLKPTKVGIVALALTHGVARSSDDSDREAVLLFALSRFNRDIIDDAGVYGSLSILDYEFLKSSVVLLDEKMKEFKGDGNLDEIEQLVASTASKVSSWDDWYDAFKYESAKINPQLASNEDGLCLIDLMDNEPLKRAYSDNVDPKVVAHDFATTFDIRTFG